jgi:phage tail-like protein
MSAMITPLHVFRFHVAFSTDSTAQAPTHEPAQLCSGAFAECTGLEASMEVKTIKEGGRNYGAAQRAGQTTFPVVVLKRGISTDRSMFKVFNSVAVAMFARRMQVVITLFDNSGAAVTAWQLNCAMPVKYKFADFNARNTEIAIEELHLAHEGLWSLESPSADLNHLGGQNSPNLASLFSAPSNTA